MIGVPFKKTHSPHRVEKLRKIWLGASGNLTICSHQRGEPGFGIIQGRQYSGGVFTEALLQELTAYRKLSEFPLALPTSMMKFARLEPQNIKCLSSIED